MVTIENTGERQYQALDKGQDPARLVLIKPGETREVSEAHADQLLKDFPKSFKKAAARKAGAS